MPTRRDQAQLDAGALRSQFSALNLPFMLEHHQAYAQTAADKHWSHLGYLGELLAGDVSGVGYLLKDRVIDVDDFLVALRRVADGGSAVDAERIRR